MQRDTGGNNQPLIGMGVQQHEVMRTGENSLSQVWSTTYYGEEVVCVTLSRKALNTLNYYSLYPKPTQVGWLSKLRGAR